MLLVRVFSWIHDASCFVSRPSQVKVIRTDSGSARLVNAAARKRSLLEQWTRRWFSGDSRLTNESASSSLATATNTPSALELASISVGTSTAAIGVGSAELQFERRTCDFLSLLFPTLRNKKVSVATFSAFKLEL